MSVVIFWILLSYFCGVYARGKHLSFGKFFWISLLISPLIGFIWCYLTPENIEKVEYEKIFVTKENKRCPHCDELIRVKAKKCKHCGSDLIKESALGNCPKCEEPRTSLAFKICISCKYTFND